MRKLLLLCVVLALGLPVRAYVVSGYFWDTGVGTFHVAIPGTAPSGISWNDAFKQAMDSWSSIANFQYLLATDAVDPCSGQMNGGFGDGATSVDFRDTACGMDFGTNTLAITLSSGTCVAKCEGDDRVRLTDADILFRSDENWSVYNGPRKSGVNDFRRVALHELGHALGLRHSSDPPAIMESFVSSVETLQSDDIAGITSIYGDAPAALTLSKSIYDIAVTIPVKTTLPGPTDSFSLNGQLTNTDNKFNNRFIDIYQYTFANDSDVTLRLQSASFDSFLYLARINSGQELLSDYLFADNDSGWGKNSELKKTIPAGTYWVGVSTALSNATGFYDLRVDASSVGTNAPPVTYLSTYGASIQINPNPSIAGLLKADDFMFGDKFLDLIQFELATPTTLRIALTAAAFDPVLMLARVVPGSTPAANLVDESSLLLDDNGGGGTDALLQQTLAAGTYWLGVTSRNAFATGSYQIDSTVVVP